MSSLTSTAAHRYDTALRLARGAPLPTHFPRPQPTCAWPPENVALLERYRVWLDSSGATRGCILHLYIPMAGHVLGLNLKLHTEIDLEVDAEQAADYIKAKQMSPSWTEQCLFALNRFRHFLRQERGYVEPGRQQPNLAKYQEGLPNWLVNQLSRYQHIRQASWRPARLKQALLRFWGGQTRLWHWLFAHYPITELKDIRRQHIFDYIDHRLAAGYAPSTINQDLRNFHAFLKFLREQDFLVPQALFHIKGLKQPDRLPRFLTDEQVRRLRDDLEQRVLQASSMRQHRNALLDRAAFYVLWHGGLRVGEAEELRLDNLDLPNRKLMVREGTGRQDRAVFLTEVAVEAFQAYLTVRGLGPTEHVFLHRNLPASKDLLRNRIKAAGSRTGVKVTPHMLRHTFATQLVNAGCRITSIQKLMGHRQLQATMVYARVHDRTVADDYYTAMAVIEKRLDCTPGYADDSQNPNGSGCRELLALVDALNAEIVNENQRMLVAEIRRGLLALGDLEKERVADN
ncbi:MAG TPA: tyrosine-type recombinase/integrase [Bacillota bacterium]|nr:tyrosine-type recombinase/integrase [Bacillota bacterium]